MSDTYETIKEIMNYIRENNILYIKDVYDFGEDKPEWVKIFKSKNNFAIKEYVRSRRHSLRYPNKKK